MLRLSALASSDVLDADTLGKIEGNDVCGGGVTTDPALVAEFWMGIPPEAVCWRRRSAVKSGADVGGSNPGFGLYADRLAKTDWNEGVVVESVPTVEDTDDEVVDEDAKTDIDA